MPAKIPSTLRRIGHLIDPRNVGVAELLIRPGKPRFECAACGRPIPRSRTLALIGETAFHIDCVGSQTAHDIAAPGCTISWHDGWDHINVIASHAAAHHLLQSPRGGDAA